MYSKDGDDTPGWAKNQGEGGGEDTCPLGPGVCTSQLVAWFELRADRIWKLLSSSLCADGSAGEIYDNDGRTKGSMKSIPSQWGAFSARLGSGDYVLPVTGRWSLVAACIH